MELSGDYVYNGLIWERVPELERRQIERQWGPLAGSITTTGQFGTDFMAACLTFQPQRCLLARM